MEKRLFKTIKEENIPECYKNADYNKVDDVIKGIFNKKSDEKSFGCDKWKGIYLCGDTGVGKTYSFYAIKFFSCLYCKMCRYY